MRRFRELPSIHQHMIGLAIVLLVAISFLVLQPAVSYELVVALGVAGVMWLVLSLTAWAIQIRRKSDPLYARFQKAYERAKATNDPRLADYEKRLAELQPAKRYFFGTTDINHGFWWYSICYVCLAVVPHSMLYSAWDDGASLEAWGQLIGVNMMILPGMRIMTIMKEHWGVTFSYVIHSFFGFFDQTDSRDGSGRWDHYRQDDK